jgi:hypothetical protein
VRVQFQQGFARIGIKIPERMVKVEKKMFVFHKWFGKIAVRFVSSNVVSV